MRTALLVSLFFALTAGSALAQTTMPALSSQASPNLVQAPAGKATKRARNARRIAVADSRSERLRGPSTVDDALSSCLVLWEPATHMTKGQWARACRRVAERLKDTTVR
ncbi:MAG TPA: hypothetical protein VG758_20310 [Hyphomicrobiaceae bacterium]|jgi:hypothetical protein|nr:hypothetical protein [Hyphomicrobiaceae bacterium]